MKRIVIDKLEHIFCPFCAAKNPKKAYVCLNCFKVMFPKEEFHWWKIRIPPSISFAVILSAFVFAVLSLANHWLNTVEANLTLNVKTQHYNLNVSADKRPNAALEQEIDFNALKSGAVSTLPKE